MGNLFEYWFLSIACLSILICGGLELSKSTDKSYWKKALPIIITYSLIEGLRWGRGVDYLHYYQDLVGRLYADYTEVLYLGWIKLFKTTWLPYWVAFVFYSALLIVAYLKLVKKFRCSAYLSIPLFYIITTLAAENLIRQYFAVPFVILCIDQLLERRWIVSFLLAICAINIHYSGIIPLVVVFVYAICEVPKIKEKISNIYTIKKPYVLILLFMFTFFFWKSSYMDEIAGYIYMFDISSDMQGAGYMSDRWLTTSGIDGYTGRRQISTIAKILLLGTYLPTIYYGFFFKKKNEKLGLIFLFSYIAIIFDNIRGDFELYGRLEQWFLYLSPILYAEVYDNLKKGNIKIIYGSVLFLQFFFYNFIREIGSMPYAGCAFVWDQ